MESRILLAIIAAIVVRAVLLLIGAWQDAHLAVKYTDIDYDVFTDAARFIVAGGSPFQRSTYRYSPLLALMLTPNITVHPAFGKVLFCAADILAAALMARLLRRRGTPPRAAAAGLALWLFSPLTVTISTRGNGEALVTCMLLGALDLLERGHLLAAGALYGLAVHWRVYPIIYAWPLVLHLSNRRIFSAASIKFAISAVAVFFGTGGALYRRYGDEFLQETYLYHATRIDPRHNFSPYFYPAYLGTQAAVPVVGDSGRAFAAAAGLLQVALGWAFADDLPAAFLLQTVAFVAFNKVATAQYFVWYLSWLPLVLQDLLSAPNRRGLGVACVAWAAALAHWLGWAYQLEFGGRGVHAGVWAAGLLWVTANAAVLRQLVVALRGRREGKKKKM